MWLRLTAMTAAVLLVATAIGCDECDNVGESWCEDNVQWGCYHRDNIFKEWFDADTKQVLSSHECPEVCVEYELQEGEPGYSEDATPRAMCALESTPCDTVDDQFCEDDILKFCKHGYVYRVQHCPEGTECEYDRCL